MSDPGRADSSITRRDALKVAAGLGAATMIPLVPARLAESAQLATATAKSQTLKFFTPAQYKTVDALVEVIIPADDHSPGARAAKVAGHIDFMLGEATGDARQAWTRGIAALDSEATARFGKAFADLTAGQQVALVAEAARGEETPSTELEKFFIEAKGHTIHGYYTSEIGIHQELKYKGNQFLAEFVGCDHPEHQP